MFHQLSQNAEYLQWWTRSKVALHHVARFTISSPQSEWIGCLLTLSSSEDKSLSTLLKSLSAPKTQFSTLDILWLLFFKIPKRMLLLQNAVGDGNTFSPNKASPLQSSYFWLQMLFLQIILCRILCKKKYSVLLDIVKITFQERLEGRHWFVLESFYTKFPHLAISAFLINKNHLELTFSGEVSETKPF